jgi:hypothetical protein
MSTPLNVERDEVTNVATIFDTTADTIEHEAEGATGCTFDGPLAGRKYTANGTAVHGGYRKIAASLQDWTKQSHNIAKTMRAAVTQYGADDAKNGDNLAGQH